MLRKKTIIVITILVLLVLAPMSVLAASKDNGAGITLYYPNSNVPCDPDELIYTTGVPTSGRVWYTFGYYDEFNDLQWVDGHFQVWVDGNLSIKYPYDLVPEGALYYAVFITAYADGEFTQIGPQLGAKWTCTPPPPPPGGEGCTPGYWKNHLDSWNATAYSTGDIFDTVFGTAYFGSTYDLGEAINAKGGGLNVVARHGTAGLLSASHPAVDYPYTIAEVIAAVVAGNVSALVDANELGCPID